MEKQELGLLPARLSTCGLAWRSSKPGASSSSLPRLQSAPGPTWLGLSICTWEVSPPLCYELEHKHIGGCGASPACNANCLRDTPMGDGRAQFIKRHFIYLLSLQMISHATSAKGQDIPGSQRGLRPGLQGMWEKVARSRAYSKSAAMSWPVPWVPEAVKRAKDPLVAGNHLQCTHAHL